MTTRAGFVGDTASAPGFPPMRCDLLGDVTLIVGFALAVFGFVRC